mgnify:CR=1 FL=1
MNEVIGNTPAGVLERIPNLKKRQRSIYYREINGVWMQTGLLPSDAQGRELYLAKGFRLTPPSDVEFLPVMESDTEKDKLYAEIADLKEQLRRKRPTKTEEV